MNAESTYMSNKKMSVEKSTLYLQTFWDKFN